MVICMSDLKRLSKQRKTAHKRLLNLNSEVYKAFLLMEKAAFSDKLLAKKHRELIAV